MNISPLAMIKAHQEKKREERQAKIAAACQKLNLTLDEVDLTLTGLDNSRSARKLGRKGNLNYKKVNATLLSRIDNEDNRFGAANGKRKLIQCGH